MKNLLFCALIISLFSSCLEKFDISKLNNTKWVLTEMKGSTLPADSKATLNFGEGLKVGGKSFCNTYGGNVEVNEDKIYLKNLFGTKMFCENTDAAERAYLSAVNNVNKAIIENNELKLFKDNEVLLVFKKTN
jgi:heat shock protein HslJ